MKSLRMLKIYGSPVLQKFSWSKISARLEGRIDPMAPMLSRPSSSQKAEVISVREDEEFRKLDIIKSKQRKRSQYRKIEFRRIPPPRYKEMDVNQDWPNVWPVARTFHPASVPLPLHQGYVPTHRAPPNKFGNAELMKIPNFLHLTPSAIQRHCEALKQFCTPWPDELSTDENIQLHFPIKVVSNDYIHSSPNIRDPRARVVSIQIKLSDLKLDEHGQDKFKRLVGKRYDPKSDLVTLVGDRCPMRHQNYEHCVYLLTALYHESSKTEAWEHKEEEDIEKYIWRGSESENVIRNNFSSAIKNENLEDYVAATCSIHNEGETKEAVEKYGNAVRSLLGISSFS